VASTTASKPSSSESGSERPLPEIPGVRHAWHQAGEVRLHVAEAGEGPVVLLLHGWPQNWFEWRELIGPLSQHYRVVCPDLRGLGWSDAPPSGYDKETLTRDMLALLDELGIDRVRLAGHDWGGWIGFLMCLMAPERVDRFLALNIAHPFSSVSPRIVLSMWRFWYQVVISAPLLGQRVVAGLPLFADPVFRWVGGMRSGWSEDEARVFLDQFAEPERARASVLIYRTFLTRDLPRLAAGRYRRRRLTTPTLLLYGTGDKVVRPVHFEGYERYADDMSVELVPDCGHFIVDEQPELVLERALAHFA
jgi:pimeloyl-ACP methyl ester carboxylesterase